MYSASAHADCGACRGQQPLVCGRTYPSWPGRRATSRLSFCARPNRLSSARPPPPSLWPSSDGASSSEWRRTPVSATGVAAAAARREEERRAAGFAELRIEEATSQHARAAMRLRRPTLTARMMSQAVLLAQGVPRSLESAGPRHGAAEAPLVRSRHGWNGPWMICAYGTSKASGGP